MIVSVSGYQANFTFQIYLYPANFTIRASLLPSTIRCYTFTPRIYPTHLLHTFAQHIYSMCGVFALLQLQPIDTEIIPKVTI